MTRRQAATSKANNRRKKQPQPGSESSRSKVLWVTVAGPVIAGLLIAWLAHLPQDIGGLVKGKSETSPSSVLASPSPVLVAVRKSDDPCESEWMVKKPPSDIPVPPSYSSDWGPWVKATGAVDLGYTNVTVTIQGRSGQVVYITGIHFNVLGRRPPIRGTAVYPQCGGPVLGRFVEVDLDYNPPRVVETSSDPNADVGEVPQEAAPLTLPYEISNRDGLVLILYGEVKKCDCIWSADIMWSSDGRNGSTQIDDNGAPFETTPSGFQTADIPVRGS